MREINPFGLRMPAELRKQLEAITKESKRSLNSEIISRLERSLNESSNQTIITKEELKQLIKEAVREELGNK